MLSSLGVVPSLTPTRRSRSLKLSCDRAPGVVLPNSDPLKLLPPSRGMMLIRTPPCPVSAFIALVETDISWVICGLL